MRTTVVPKDRLNDEQMKFYDYTCQREDVVRSFMLASPGNDLDNLMAEKQILDIF